MERKNLAAGLAVHTEIQMLKNGFQKNKQIVKMTKKKAVFNWSGGKDSALALYKILKENQFDVIALLTTINEDSLTSSIHAIPIEMLQKQAKSIGIPLYPVLLSKDRKTYEEGMIEAVTHFKNLGVTHFIFGDIFLSDIKSYREKNLNPHDIEVIEPLWGSNSEKIMQEFISSGLKTKIIVTQAKNLDKSYIGKIIDADFVKSYPENLDLCGENGEYHTFSFDGPIFSIPVECEIQKIEKINYEFKLEDGNIKKFEYWQAFF